MAPVAGLVIDAHGFATPAPGQPFVIPAPVLGLPSTQVQMAEGVNVALDRDVLLVCIVLTRLVIPFVHVVVNPSPQAEELRANSATARVAPSSEAAPFINAP